MSKRDSFLLRIDPALLDALKRWAESELRSTNAHIEYILRRALADAGRNPNSPKPESSEESNGQAT